MKQIYPLELKRKINVKSPVTVITVILDKVSIVISVALTVSCCSFLAELNDRKESD